MATLDHLLVELERAAATGGESGSTSCIIPKQMWPSWHEYAVEDDVDDYDSGAEYSNATHAHWSGLPMSHPSRAPSKLERWKSDVLEGWFMNHLSRPYPVKKDKTRLAAETQLTEMQVCVETRPHSRFLPQTRFAGAQLVHQHAQTSLGPGLGRSPRAVYGFRAPDGELARAKRSNPDRGTSAFGRRLWNGRRRCARTRRGQRCLRLRA